MLLIILLFVWAGVKTSSTYNKLEGKAEPLISKVLEEQSSSWDYEILKPHLSNIWLKMVDENQSNKLMKLFSKLGAFKSIDEIKWTGCSIKSNTEFGTIDRCDYTASASYENGAAYISVGIVLEGNEPKIIQLHINSNAFLE